MSAARDDDRGYVRGAKGFGTDKGISPATTMAEGKRLYEKIWATGKVMSDSGVAESEGSAKSYAGTKARKG